MRRTAVLALILSLGSTSVALAGEPLLAVATRAVREGARNQASLQSKPAAKTSAEKSWASALAQEPAVSASGMRKRTKVLIFMGAAAGFVATAYMIDHNVEDVTPSSLGLRQD